MSENQTDNMGAGQRAEDIACWYLRLNGFMLTDGFVVHPEKIRSDSAQVTEADIYGVRFPYSQERYGITEIRELIDDGDANGMDLFRGFHTEKNIPLFILVEVKSWLTKINGPWSSPEKKAMQTVISRMGCLPPDAVNSAAISMYENLYYECSSCVIQYITIGAVLDKDLSIRYPKLKQISFKHISEFFYDRFRMFPEKISKDKANAHKSWPKFLCRFGYEVTANGSIRSPAKANEFFRRYIDCGLIDDPQ